MCYIYNGGLRFDTFFLYPTRCHDPKLGINGQWCTGSTSPDPFQWLAASTSACMQSTVKITELH